MTFAPDDLRVERLEELVDEVTKLTCVLEEKIQGYEYVNDEQVRKEDEDNPEEPPFTDELTRANKAQDVADAVANKLKAALSKDSIDEEELLNLDEEVESLTSDVADLPDACKFPVVL